MCTPKMELIKSCNICESTEIETVDTSSNFCRCIKCDYVFDSPRPTQEEIVAFYSKPSQYDDWLADEDERNSLWMRRIRKIAKHNINGSLLDIGAGIGQFLHLIQEHQCEVLGVEVSISAISVAKNRYNIDIIAGDAISADIPIDRGFDMVTMFHVLEHVPNPKQVIDRCYSLLNHSGILVIAVPNDVVSLRYRSLAMIRRILGRWGVEAYKDAGKFGFSRISLEGTMNEIHLSHFTPNGLQKFLERSGFEIIENSLDPYYVASGLKGILHRMYYLLMCILKVLLNKNYYETIWITARKR